MATIFDIAKKAGVSITTVSRALNGYSDVNEKTRQRISAIAEELNYYPNAAARSLQGKKTNTIAFAPWLPEHSESEPFFKEFIGLLALSCLKHDLSLLVKIADSPKNTAEAYRELAGTGRVDGIILADVKPQDDRIPLIKDLGLPFTAFGRTFDYARLDYPFVDVDGAAGIEMIINYLYQRGYRRIAYLSGPFNTSYALHRYSGYQAGLKTHGLEEDPRLVVRDLQEQAETSEAVGQLFNLPGAEWPSAIIANNDRLALKVITALKDRGLSVGRKRDQIAVTGFDDLAFASYINPALTTVRQPLEATCTALLDLLVAIMKNQVENLHLDLPPGMTRLGPEQFLIRPELVIRGSA